MVIDIKAVREKKLVRGFISVDGKENAGVYLNARDLDLTAVEGINGARLENLARILRGFIFAAVDGAKSGHPGGSSSKVEQVLALISCGVLAFDALDPKNPGRDRIVWSAGHCSPLFHATIALVYECLRRKGRGAGDKGNRGNRGEDWKELGAVFPEDLARFRHCDGPSGHIESHYPLADVSTGSSGHGFSAALGLALLQKSNGLTSKVWVFAGDAETEEGMSYEARNSINAMGIDNLIVSLDYNNFGIDGPITEVMAAPYINYWTAAGWNVIEVDGHNILEVAAAYRKAFAGFGNFRPTVVICRTIKGKGYGKLEGTADSHGTPAPHQEYVEIMKKLGFDIPGVEGEIAKDIEVIALGLEEKDLKYLISRLLACKGNIKPEAELIKIMKTALKNRPMKDYRQIKRPENLSPELLFKEGETVATRKATEAFFKWLMNESAFFYAGAGDLSKSILTSAAENVYGVISRVNPLGRGVRFGIAEANMAMMSTTLTQDILPGGFKAMSVFSSYGVFTSIMANSVRMALINNAVNPKFNGFFIMLAAHDGPETGEDGPTHQGLFWMSLFNSYPGIKVYKPLDANETIEMLFYALSQGEPIALSVARPGTQVFLRGKNTAYGFAVPSACEAVNGAYVFKPFRDPSTTLGASKPKKVLAICGGQLMANTLEVLPELEKDFDIKIIAVTSPELYEELRQRDPQKAQAILSDEERQFVITLHNGWPGFLHPFVLPPDYEKRALGISQYLKSGPPAEVYQLAGMDAKSLKEKIFEASK